MSSQDYRALTNIIESGTDGKIDNGSNNQKKRRQPRSRKLRNILGIQGVMVMVEKIVTII